MERYDYLHNITEDIKSYITDNFTADEITEHLNDREGWEQALNDDLWIADSVTGNASGSYTFSAWKPEEYIAHNLDLLAEAMHEFGCEYNYLEKGAEFCDVTIRCYLLGQAIAQALDELNNE